MKRNCKYFPCHKDMDDCDMCYCIAYPCEINETGGKFIKDKNHNDIWDCSDCNIVHKSEFIKSLRTIIIDTIKTKL